MHSVSDLWARVSDDLAHLCVHPLSHRFSIGLEQFPEKRGWKRLTSTLKTEHSPPGEGRRTGGRVLFGVTGGMWTCTSAACGMGGWLKADFSYASRASLRAGHMLPCRSPPSPFETESPSWDHMVPKCSQGPAGKETRKMKRVPTSVTSKICQFERDKKADGPGYWHVGGRRMNPKDLCTS